MLQIPIPHDGRGPRATAAVGGRCRARVELAHPGRGAGTQACRWLALAATETIETPRPNRAVPTQGVDGPGPSDTVVVNVVDDLDMPSSLAFDPLRMMGFGGEKEVGTPLRRRGDGTTDLCRLHITMP